MVGYYETSSFPFRNLISDALYSLCVQRGLQRFESAYSCQPNQTDPTGRILTVKRLIKCVVFDGKEMSIFVIEDGSVVFETLVSQE